MSAVHVAWERDFNRLRLYGTPREAVEVVERDLRGWLQTNHMWDRKSIPVPTKVYMWLRRDPEGEMEKMRSECGLEKAELDLKERRPKVRALGNSVLQLCSASTARPPLEHGSAGDSGRALPR